MNVRVIAASFDGRPDKLFRPRAHGGRGNPGSLSDFPDVHAQSFMYRSDFTTWGILLDCFLVTYLQLHVHADFVPSLSSLI